MQILCRFLRVRKSPQNTAIHGILGGEKWKRECYSSATATYLDEARNVVNKGFASRKGGLLHHYYTILEEFWYSKYREKDINNNIIHFGDNM